MLSVRESYHKVQFIVMANTFIPMQCYFHERQIDTQSVITRYQSDIAQHYTLTQ